jgi:hypothetical protein
LLDPLVVGAAMLLSSASVIVSPLRPRLLGV